MPQTFLTEHWMVLAGGLLKSKTNPKPSCNLKHIWSELFYIKQHLHLEWGRISTCGSRISANAALQVHEINILSQNYPKAEPEHHQEPSSLICSGLLYSPIKHQTAQKTLHKILDLQHEPELWREFSLSSSTDGRCILVLPCFSGAQEQIYQEFGYSVFVYWAQMSQFLKCYA